MGNQEISTLKATGNATNPPEIPYVKSSNEELVFNTGWGNVIFSSNRSVGGVHAPVQEAKPVSSVVAPPPQSA